MITTPISRLADLLSVNISSMNRADAQDAVCAEAEKNIRANQHRINQLHGRVAQTERENAELRAQLDMFQGKSNYPEFPDGSLTDTDRLNYLDSLNKEFNERNGSNYGWEIDWNHTRIALHDIGPMGMSVRQAIDEHRGRFMSNRKTKEARHD